MCNEHHPNYPLFFHPKHRVSQETTLGAGDSFGELSILFLGEVERRGGVAWRRELSAAGLDDSDAWAAGSRVKGEKKGDPYFPQKGRLLGFYLGPNCLGSMLVLICDASHRVQSELVHCPRRTTGHDMDNNIPPAMPTTGPRTVRPQLGPKSGRSESLFRS